MRLADLPTPQILIDRRRVMRNIERVQRFASDAGMQLRPHAKTHKSPAVAKWQIERGAIGICCAKVGEAEVFADAGRSRHPIALPCEPVQRGAPARADGSSVHFDHRRPSRRGTWLVRRDGVRRPNPRRAHQSRRRLSPLRDRSRWSRWSAARVHQSYRVDEGPQPERAVEPCRARLSRLVGSGARSDRGTRSGNSRRAPRQRGTRGYRARGAVGRRHTDAALQREAARLDGAEARQLRLFRSHAGLARSGGNRQTAHSRFLRRSSRSIQDGSFSTAAARRSRTIRRGASRRRPATVRF